MKNSGLQLTDSWHWSEKTYDLSTEPHIATLMTTGNGYIGVRGSLEEYGSLRIQGCYIRGVTDWIYDIRLPYCDNLYMKKYYFNEDKLKDFEKQECIINLIDFLLIRFTVDGETFFPWEGKVLEWERTLDIRENCLYRRVVWENSRGDVTEFRFERFSSFADDHIYALRAEATPLNHDKPMTVLSGMDLRTKTYGQRTTTGVSSSVKGRMLYHELTAGSTYNFGCGTGVLNRFSGTEDAVWSEVVTSDTVAHQIVYTGQKGVACTLEKTVYIITSRDTEEPLRQVTEAALEWLCDRSYATLKQESLCVYNPLFARLDIRIEGDPEADGAVRFSNYHTLLSLPRNDAVHSLSAKALTGEVYNNFVWWDAEVYQVPVFLQTMPEYVHHTIRYRYNRLDAARTIAASEGRRGARYPFTSCVTGEETVWMYARHPFMQVHIVSDIGLAVLRYLDCTGDEAFFLQYGLEMLLEIGRYWADRVEWNGKTGRYEIRTVTGTDEHHPYVDNNAYTNYSVHRVLTRLLRLKEEYEADCARLEQKIGMQPEEWNTIRDVAERLYLPLDKKTGMIPQFDGYFDLKRSLEIQGGTTAKSFQMKQSGLYNESQVIKQPDVMLLFAYMDMPFTPLVYQRNWDYYEARCESSSSLSYSVHAICAADCMQPERTYKYLMKTARLDLDDDHDCAHEGIHAACAAGAWLAVARGVAGMRMTREGVNFAPRFIPWWESVSYHAVWHGVGYRVTVNNEQLAILVDAEAAAALPVTMGGQTTSIQPGERCTFALKAE